MKSIITKRANTLAWFPAVVLIAASLMIVAGVSVISKANAASGSAGTAVVTGTVGGGVLTGLGPTGTCTGESITNFASSFAKSDGCTVQFGSNNAIGTELTFVDADGSAPFFCTKANGTAPNTAAGGDCTTVNIALGDNNRSVKNAPAIKSACNVADCFGLALMSVAGDAGIGATFGSAVANPASYATPGVPIGSDLAWTPVDAATHQLCKTTAANTASTDCTFAFGAQGDGATQASGSYAGAAAFTATTL